MSIKFMKTGNAENNELSRIAKNSLQTKQFEKNGTIRKDSNDELKYLQNKFKGYSFFAAEYKKGMRYGSVSTVNVAISPKFLDKMAKNPSLAAKYENKIAGMKENDKQTVKEQAVKGNRITSQGWAINSNGGISKWSFGSVNTFGKRYTGTSARSGSSALNTIPAKKSGSKL